MSRSQRFRHGIGWGYVYQALLMIVGVWLTPFLLSHIGQRDYGVWVVGSQLLAYLGLLDIGLVALLPRETAHITGGITGGDERDAHLRLLFGQKLRLVLYQLPLVVAGLTLAWIFMPSSWLEFQGPIALTMATFVLCFPLRLFQAVLQGLQDFRFLARLQLLAWIASTAATVILVLAGFRILSLAIGFAVMQLLIAAGAMVRLYKAFNPVFPSRLPQLSWGVSREYLRQGSWVSLSQFAVPLLNGADILIMGKLFGPSAVVPYACTAKLIGVLTNQPTLLMQAAQPGLSELKAGAPRDRMVHAVTALTQALLMLSGLVACIILTVNRTFVTWWVGPDQYGGTTLTVLFVINMLLRHWNTTAVYTVFCFGYEKRICLTTLLDACTTVAASLLFVSQLGLIGAPMGSILSVCVTSLPLHLSVLKRELGISLSELLAPLWPWFWRFALLFFAGLSLAIFWRMQGFLGAVGISALAALSYASLMFRAGQNSALGSYLIPQFTPFFARLSWFRSLGQ